MTILMEALENKFKPFGECGISNSEARSNKKSRDNEDLENELEKEQEKERPSFSAITSSQSLFKVEAEVDIKSYQGEIDAIKLNQWLQPLEVYFSAHNILEE
jgi:hypothetical protein